jgi:ATP-binding cassette subfamily B protein
MNGQENAKIAQGGSNVSGGQKQRLAIARAIARKPEILVFDDSFSALDYETDRNLRRALNEKLTGVTQIIVAQRIGTIKDADKIIVLDHGQIVGQGKHEDLLQTCPTYQEIAASQLSKKELEDA